MDENMKNHTCSRYFKFILHVGLKGPVETTMGHSTVAKTESLTVGKPRGPFPTSRQRNKIQHSLHSENMKNHTCSRYFKFILHVGLKGPVETTMGHSTVAKTESLTVGKPRGPFPTSRQRNKIQHSLHSENMKNHTCSRYFKFMLHVGLQGPVETTMGPSTVSNSLRAMMTSGQPQCLNVFFRRIYRPRNVAEKGIDSQWRRWHMNGIKTSGGELIPGTGWPPGNHNAIILCFCKEISSLCDLLKRQHTKFTLHCGLRVSDLLYKNGVISMNFGCIAADWRRDSSSMSKKKI